MLLNLWKKLRGNQETILQQGKIVLYRFEVVSKILVGTKSFNMLNFSKLLQNCQL